MASQPQHNEDMLSGGNLHFSSLLFLFSGLLASMATAQSDVQRIIPSAGGRPELLTVFDMRKDPDQADRVLAKSAQGLMNAEPLRTDKIYLIFTYQDQQWLKSLKERQYVLSSGNMHDLEELIRRWPNRDALLASDKNLDVAACAAACEGLLLVIDPKLVSKYHLTVRKDLSKGWSSEAEAQSWLLAKYGDRINKRVVGLVGSGGQPTDMMDYQFANRMFMFSTGENNDALMDILTHDFDRNIPCITVGQAQTLQAQANMVSRAAKFVIPATGLSNLSVWTTFRPYSGTQDEQNSGAVGQPRARYSDPNPVHLGQWLTPDRRAGKARLAWLAELAPPLYETFARQRNGLDIDRNTYRLGLVRDDVYGFAYEDRETVWNDYLDLTRRSLDNATRK